MSELTNNHEEIIAKLRDGLDQSDPMPSDVFEFAKALFTWRDIDAQLAEVAYDSSTDTSLSGVRSTAVARMMSFQAGKWLVDLEYDEPSTTLMGRVSPDTTFNVELHSRGAHFSVTSDDAGRFAFEGVSPGPISLVIRIDEGPVIKTSWVIL
jgi:hypothetical protein